MCSAPWCSQWKIMQSIGSNFGLFCSQWKENIATGNIHCQINLQTLRSDAIFAENWASKPGNCVYE